MGDFFPSVKDKKVKPDKCSTCTCHNENSECKKETCPVLECSAEHQIYNPNECCPTCPKELGTELSSSTCTYKGVTYQVTLIIHSCLRCFTNCFQILLQSNQTWILGPCRSCECRAGEIRCAQAQCPIIKCRPNENLIIPQGQCCAKCIESPGKV